MELAQKISAARPSTSKDPAKTAEKKIKEIEHVLTLEAIEPPQPNANAKRPREAKRNTPKYAKCVECLKKGKETTAIYVCLTCTKNPEEERLLCEDCVEKHESKDHYVEKILY